MSSLYASAARAPWCCSRRPPPPGAAREARMSFARIDQSPVARWWWTIDRWTLLALAVLIGFGAVLTMAASPAVAERIGLDGMHFVRRQLALLPVAILLMFL